jgi:hypothetical protein
VVVEADVDVVLLALASMAVMGGVLVLFLQGVVVVVSEWLWCREREGVD